MFARLAIRIRTILLAVLLAAALGVSSLDAQEIVGWPTEYLTLEAGGSIRGVTVAANKEGVDFAEVVRPPGKPMFVVIRRFAHREIAKLRKLDPKARATSLKQLALFRDRVRIEQLNMESVELEDDEFEGLPARRHTATQFTLWSTADEETTRRCAVRIDQMFRAYQQLFPPQRAERPLRILLFGSLEQYGDFLRGHGLNVQNPAFYSQKQNLIVAATEVGDFGTRLAEIRKRHAKHVVQLEALNKRFLEQFQSLRVELQAAGFTPDEITFEKTARLRAWNDERERQLKKIATANRRNDLRFDELTQRMFRRLNHEAFHAYVENHVYPGRERALPRWYDEGLAQVFESGQLEAGLLRIDAPDAARLNRLRRDFAALPRLSLLQLVTAEPRDFIDAHENPQANRYYLHAWAVAYYLTFIAPRTTEQIDAFARNTNSGPIERFTEFAGDDIETVDRKWRAAILGLAVED